jgi:electron transfer flavoprotein beta subunit
LPCVVTVKEGINLPRYPSLPGRLRAKRAAITRVPGPVGALGGTQPAAPAARADQDVRMTSLRVPDSPKRQATVVGQGAAAVPALVNVLVELGVVS